MQVENNKIQLTSNIFPNPNNGCFEIALDEKFSGKINIFDINGRLCWGKDFFEENENISISVQNLKSGMYFLNAKSFDGKLFINKKIIIQK